MEIKKFGNYVNEHIEEKSFMEKLEEDFDVMDEVKSILTISLESVDGNMDKITNMEDFRDYVTGILRVDATNLVSFDIDKQIDLCIYAEEQGAEPCPTVKWDYLTQEISKTAVQGLVDITMSVLDKTFFVTFEKFMTKNKLEYSQISSKEAFGMAAPAGVQHIDSGEINKYRKLDGDYNIDEYVYRDEELGIELYIKKKV